MVTIGIEKHLGTITIHKQRCLENINKLYKSDGKCDDQQQYNAIIESVMVSTPEIFTYNSPMSPCPYVAVKNTSSRKSLHIFTGVLDVKQKTAVRQVCAAKSNRKATIDKS